MRNILKYFLVCAIAVSMLVSMSLTVMAKEEIEIGEAEKGIYASFDCSKFEGKWDGDVERSADGTSLVLPYENAGNFGGWYAKGLKKDTVYKVGYYITLDKDYNKELKDDDRVLRLKPHGEDLYLNFTIGELKEYAGKKILIVAVMKEKDDNVTTNIGGWKSSNNFGGKLDKIVLATHDHNFLAEKSDYTLMVEAVVHDGDAAYKPSDDEWVKSEEVEEQEEEEEEEQEEEENKEKEKENEDKNSGTGDAGMLLAYVVTAAAAFGGIKLRRK